MIMDAYNANPASVREALTTLRELRGPGNAFVILADMLELGDKAQALHEEIGGLLAETGIEAVFLKGTLSRFTAEGALKKGFPEEQIVYFDNPGEVVAALGQRLKKGDWILIKGSRKMKMEAVAEAIIAAFDLRR
jgi:UDP-N-acetylmuramoyl-tripeptide--D-alanyl-D-alanine ligase